MSTNECEKKFNRICEKVLINLSLKENKFVNEEGSDVEAIPIGEPKLFEYHTIRTRNNLENRVVYFEKIIELAPKSADSYISGVSRNITPTYMTRDELYIVPIQYYKIIKTENLD